MGKLFHDGVDYSQPGVNSGSTVSWTQITQTGTKIASISINGSSTDVYAPTSGGGSTAWGDITGTLSNQTDLIAALNSVKADVINYVNINILGGLA